mgnify:CR=1 FL=1
MRLTRRFVVTGRVQGVEQAADRQPRFGGVEREDMRRGSERRQFRREAGGEIAIFGLIQLRTA